MRGKIPITAHNHEARVKNLSSLYYAIAELFRKFMIMTSIAL